MQQDTERTHRHVMALWGPIHIAHGVIMIFVSAAAACDHMLRLEPQSTGANGTRTPLADEPFSPP